jgi:hypothetical protein
MAAFASGLFQKARAWASSRTSISTTWFPRGSTDALTLVSETIDESPHANAINRLAWEIKHRAQRLETRRADLLRLTQSNCTV